MELKASQLKAVARGHLTGKYAFPIVAYMLADMIISTVSMIVSLSGSTNSATGQLINLGISLIMTAIGAILIVGQNKICLHLARSTEYPKISDLFYGFKGHADNIILVFFLVFIREVAFSVPFGLAAVFCMNRPGIYSYTALALTAVFSGIMCMRVELDYAMVYFLINDYPDQKPADILKKSKEMMYGKRGKYLYLLLSFIGMLLLVALSFGFAIFWVEPYIRMTQTEFYLNLNNTEENCPL